MTDRADPYRSDAAASSDPAVLAGETAMRSLRPPVSIVMGGVYGFGAAVFYTLCNITLRDSVDVDPFLVSAAKATPTVVFLTPMLVWMSATGRTIWTSLALAPRFAGVALLGQFVGNAGFQWALGSIGLAASVPITLGMMLIGGALLGRFVLGEPVKPRAVLSILMLITAVVLLSWPDADQVAVDAGGLPRWAGALCAASSGAAYALFGTVMRQAMGGGLSPPLAMWISGIIGTVSLWAAAAWVVAPRDWAAISVDQWWTIAIAGVLNFVAFVSLSMALKSLPIVAVNLINASQVAMAATAGVLIFGESLDATLIAGILLTFLGLIILVRRNGRLTN